MSTDAVRTAGSVFSISRVLTRSAVAAGQAVAGELEGLQHGTAAMEVGPAGSTMPGPAPASVVSGPVSPGLTLASVVSGPVSPGLTLASAASGPVSPGLTLASDPASQTLRSPNGPDSQPALAAPPLPTGAPLPTAPPLHVAPDQATTLGAARTAVVAVNRDGHPPQLTMATILWDGETLRFATLGWARRTTMLRADPRIALLVDGDQNRFLTVDGRAAIVEGPAAREAARPLLLREVGSGGEIAAEARWHELIAEDADRAVIVVTPEQVLSGLRPA